MWYGYFLKKTIIETFHDVGLLFWIPYILYIEIYIHYITLYTYIYIYERETSVCMCYTITVKQKTQRLSLSLSLSFYVYYIYIWRQNLKKNTDQKRNGKRKKHDYIFWRYHRNKKLEKNFGKNLKRRIQHY